MVHPWRRAGAARAGRRRLALLAGLLSLIVWPTFPALTVPAAAQTAALPGLPARWPASLHLGLNDGPGGAAAMAGMAPFGFRYQYLSGGVNTGNGWATWNADGQFVTYYVQDSLAHGITPVFTYYMIYQSAPGNSQSESDGVATNLQNTATMTAYFNDLKLFFQRAGAFSNQLVVLHVDPDLWGYAHRRASGDNATTVAARVGATGLSELAGLPDNLAGVAQAVVRLRNRYAPNVAIAYHLSIWGTGNDILYSNPPDATVDALATRAGNFYRSLGADFDVVFGEFSDRDAGFKQHVYNDGGASWWDQGDFSRHVRFLSRFVQVAQERVVLWQIPFGNTKMRAMNNTWNHYQDNKVEWLLDESARTHLQAYLQAGVVAFLFGRGADGTTCPCDANRDGVTNPAPINGNTGDSLNADDDGGFFRQKAGEYYSRGALSLSGGTAPPPVPTSTSTPAPTSVPSATATPARTATPAPPARTATPAATSTVSRTTISFDDKGGQNQPLNGQYPDGVIDWGSGQWYHSGPWGAFSTKSISFDGRNNPGRTSAAFTFVSPRRLVSLRAYNGGGSASTVTLACPGQPTKTASVGARQVVTIQTDWTAPCAQVTLGSSNGWDTNFDDLVIE